MCIFSCAISTRISNATKPKAESNSITWLVEHHPGPPRPQPFANKIKATQIILAKTLLLYYSMTNFVK